MSKTSFIGLDIFLHKAILFLLMGVGKRENGIYAFGYHVRLE